MSGFEKRHAPKKLDDLVMDAYDRQMLQDHADLLRDGSIILHGPVGTGKTAAAEILAAGRCVTSPEIFDGSTMTDADFKRIDGWSNWERVNGNDHPLVVINEVDKLTPKMQQRLRAEIDSTSGLSPDFVMTTNEPHSVDERLADRCEKIEMPSPNPSDWAKRGQEILAREGINVSAQEIEDLLASKGGSIREFMRALEDLVVDRKRTR